MAEGRYAEAVPHLEEDLKNCLTARLLLTAYEKTGSANDAESLRHRLATSFRAESDGVTADHVVEKLFQTVREPIK